MARLGGRGGFSSRRREEKVKEAARLHMKLGDMQRYCELMVEVGEVGTFITGILHFGQTELY